MPPAKHEEVNDDRPITSKALFVWGGAMLAICTTLVSIVWFCASVKQDVALVQQQLNSHIAEGVEKRVARDKELAELRERMSKQEIVNDDLKEKMTRALTILERLDKAGVRQ